LKPTEGRVPNSGHIFPGTVKAVRHLAVSGPLARSVADLRLGLEVIAGPDGRDLDVAPAPLTAPPPRPIRSYRFAWTDDFGGLPVTADTRAAMQKLANDLSDVGSRVERAGPKDFDLESVWKIYGELYGAIAGVLFPPLLRAVVRLLGPFIVKDAVSRAGAQTATASLKRFFVILEQRDRLTQALEKFLADADYDGWLCPVASTPAFPHRKMGKIHTPIDVDGVPVPGNIAGTGYTCAFNLTGSPVVAMPLAMSGDGLPIGVQVVGRRWGEMELLNVAEAMTPITGAFRRPPGA